jgi:DNA repair protein SbcD/Mre11
MIRFIHTADIHFGVENYGRIDAATGIHSRLLDFKRALDFCIDRALAQQVDFFLFCGDAYKTTNPSPTQQRLLLRCFLRLYQAKIPIIIIVGNHDNPLSFGKATTLDIFGDLPLDGFHVIAKPASFVLQTKSGPVQIVGMPWPSRHTIRLQEKHSGSSAQEITAYLSEAVSTIIQGFAQQLDPELPAVFAGHLTVSSGIFSGSEKKAIYGTDPVLLPSQLALPPFDYVALGHLHRYQNLNPHAHPAIVYSGSIERVDFGERKEDKGFCLVAIENKNTTTHQFIPIPTRPFIQIEVNLEPGKSQTDQIIEALGTYDITDAVIKIIYYIPAGKQDQADLNIIMRACSHALHVVSITPVLTAPVRERRLSLKTEMDFQEALHSYFSGKIQNLEEKQRILDKTLALAQEALLKEQQEEENSLRMNR